MRCCLLLKVSSRDEQWHDLGHALECGLPVLLVSLHPSPAFLWSVGFQQLVRATWTKGDNEEFLGRVARMAQKQRWKQLVNAFRTAVNKVQRVAPSPQPMATDPPEQGAGVVAGPSEAAAGAVGGGGDEGGRKRKREGSGGGDGGGLTLRAAWRAFAVELDRAEHAANAATSGFAFAFREGQLVTALRQGHWLLLDEINLAPPEVSRPSTSERYCWAGCWGGLRVAALIVLIAVTVTAAGTGADSWHLGGQQRQHHSERAW